MALREMWRWMRASGSALALVVVSCSDDGTTPQDGTDSAAGTEASSSASASASGQTQAGTADSAGSDSSPSSTGTGVTTASTSGSDTEGTSGGSGTTGMSQDPTPCEVDEDCEVVDDCCTCGSITVGDAPPLCELQECAQSKCGEYEVDVPAAVCRFGTCQLEPVECNENLVVCDVLPPVCDEGFVPTVGDDGCWTGRCLPADLCNVVPDCTYCSENETCVTRTTQVGFESICEPIAPQCAGAPTCACMDPCTDPFVCSDGGDPGAELVCDCPVCL